MPLISYRRQHFKVLKQIADLVRLETIRTLNARTSATLYCLPIELIRHICQYLPTAGTFCLIISSARFWDARTSITAFIRVQKQLSAESYKSWELVEARFHILRLMEFDKLYTKGIGSFCCWACMRTHPKSSFNYNLQGPVNLKFSIEEQRFNSSAAITRSCKYRRRKIWVGICYEMTWAELRILVFGMRTCKTKAQSSITIRAGGYFSEQVEFNLKTNRLLSRFYLGRVSDLGLKGFDDLCWDARIPICPHVGIDWLAKVFLRCMKPGDVRECCQCRTRFYVIITSHKMIELHISRYVGPLSKHLCDAWIRASYDIINPAFVRHCQAFSNWLNTMYNPDTGAIYSGCQFEMFKPAQKPKCKYHGKNLQPSILGTQMFQESVRNVVGVLSWRSEKN